MKAEKLELKHLAPYLPYKLRYAWKGKSLRTLKEEVEERGVITYKGTSDNMGKVLEGSEFFPILRPLSDLSKFSEDVGINKHSINLMLEERYNLDYGVFSHYEGEIDIELDGDSSVGYDQNKSIPFNVVMDIQNELLKAHYDIFGLIEKGLAIDINSLSPILSPK